MLRINPKAVQQAAVMIGIREPLHIRWMSATECATRPETLGFHRRQDDGHLIALRPDRSAEETSRTIAHELLHASHCEALGSASYAQLTTQHKAEIERQCEEIARALPACLRLVAPASPDPSSPVAHPGTPGQISRAPIMTRPQSALPLADQPPPLRTDIVPLKTT